jgi:hybrid cluster-associated redox disulfide protein
VNVLITKDMSIGDIVDQYPETVSVFISHGLGCIGCAIAQFETLEEGAMAHGIDVEALLKDLNKSLEK